MINDLVLIAAFQDIILNLILSVATLVTSTVMLKICSGTDLDGLSEVRVVDLQVGLFVTNPFL